MSKTEPSGSTGTPAPGDGDTTGPGDTTGAGANLFQSRFWAQHKQRFGWEAAVDGGAAGTPLVLRRTLPGPFSICYVPYGGGGEETHLPPSEGFRLEEYVTALRKAAAAFPGATFLRWDIPFPEESIAPEELATTGLVKAAVDVQPPTTVVLDLRKSEDELLGGMKGKTRYNVRLASKRGVTVERTGSPDSLRRWYELYRITALRDRITIHSEAYYRSLFELAAAGEGPSVDLYMASHEGDLLAGIIVARFGAAAYYLYGASSNTKRNLMPAYALQWRAIQDARAAGAGSYDFFGIPPAEDPKHPMHGLYRFKVGFGGTVVRRPGAYDLPLRRLGYRLYRSAEGWRNRYYKGMRKRGR